MPVFVKKAGAYVAIVGIQVKKNGVYTAVAGAFVKTAGAYQSVLGPVAPTNVYSAFTQDGLRSSASPAPTTMTDSNRFSQRAINPASNTVTFGVSVVAQLNQIRNPPTTGFVTLAPGQEVFCDGVDATKQMWQRVEASNNRAVSATVSTGLVATVTLVNHGYVTGDVRAHDGFTPSGYNSLSQPITRIDADTYTYPLAATAGAVTVLGYVYNSSESLIIEQGDTA